MSAGRAHLVMIPGTLCDAAVWDYQVNHISDLAECSVADLRGHDDLVDMAAAILASTDAAQLAVAGHSMGGRVALEMVRQDASRISRLALLDTGVHSKQPGEDERRQRTIDRARASGTQALLEAWIPQIVHPDRLRDRALVDKIERMILRFTPDDVAKQNRAMLSRTNLAPLLPTISCPVMLLCGRQDEYSPVSRHEEMLGSIPNAWLQIIDDCGHMSAMERPQAVTACMRDWLIRS